MCYLLVDPFSWNGLKQQLTLVDTFCQACTHERTPREKPNNNYRRLYLARSTSFRPTFSPHCISFFRHVSFLLLSLSPYRFYLHKNSPTHLWARASDRKTRARARFYDAPLTARRNDYFRPDDQHHSDSICACE